MTQVIASLLMSQMTCQWPSLDDGLNKSLVMITKHGCNTVKPTQRNRATPYGCGDAQRPLVCRVKGGTKGHSMLRVWENAFLHMSREHARQQAHDLLGDVQGAGDSGCWWRGLDG